MLEIDVTVKLEVMFSLNYLILNIQISESLHSQYKHEVSSSRNVLIKLYRSMVNYGCVSDDDMSLWLRHIGSLNEMIVGRLLINRH